MVDRYVPTASAQCRAPEFRLPPLSESYLVSHRTTDGESHCDQGNGAHISRETTKKTNFEVSCTSCTMTYAGVRRPLRADCRARSPGPGGALAWARGVGSRRSRGRVPTRGWRAPSASRRAPRVCANGCRLAATLLRARACRWPAQVGNWREQALKRGASRSRLRACRRGAVARGCSIDACAWRRVRFRRRAVRWSRECSRARD